MTVSVPVDSAGAPDPLRGAEMLYHRARWIRRRWAELTAEATVDVFKVYDLAGNCQSFVDEADKWLAAGDVTAQVRETLVDLTRRGTAAQKTAAEIGDDYKALYQACGAWLTWATANLPAAGMNLPGSPAVTVNKTWPSTDLTVRVPKVAAMVTQLAALGAVFA